jgi:hypothetical protein
VEQQSRLIGDETYYVTQLDAISSLKIQTKLIKILGKSAISLLNGKNIQDKLQDVILSIAENFDDEVVNQFVLSLFDKNIFIKKNGHLSTVEFQTHFAGKPLDMWKVAGFILEVNFSLGELIGSTLPTTEKGDKEKKKES